MSSYTFSSKSHRRFVLAFLALVLVPVSVLFGVSLYLQPLYGDLTRVGSFAENDFGWNKPLLAFERPLYDNSLYDHYYDVVVLGDSFSTVSPLLQWQNYLVASSGLSVITLDIGKVGIAQVLDNPVFRNTPPKVLILESVERELPGHVRHEPTCASDMLTPVAHGKKPYTPKVTIHEDHIRHIAKPTDRKTTWDEIKLGYVRDYLLKSLIRRLGYTGGKAVKVDLASDAPFSSSTKNAMLVYRNDFRKEQWWREVGVPQIACRMERLREQVESNGATQFILMVPPDKLTAYADFVRDEDLRRLSALPALASELPHLMPRLDIALISAIRQGASDIYLPDDTHWGSSGHRIAAETLLTFMQRRP